MGIARAQPILRALRAASADSRPAEARRIESFKIVALPPQPSSGQRGEPPVQAGADEIVLQRDIAGPDSERTEGSRRAEIARTAAEVRVQVFELQVDVGPYRVFDTKAADPAPPDIRLAGTLPERRDADAFP
jgi:hypothetical protein